MWVSGKLRVYCQEIYRLMGRGGFLCGLNNCAVEAEGSGVHDRSWLNSKFRASMSRFDPVSKNKRQAWLYTLLIPALER